MKKPKNLFRVGDLICYDTGYYNNGRFIHQYCKILDIEQNNQSIDEILLITGHGDKNTKAKFLLKILGTETGTYSYEMNGRIDESDLDIVSREDRASKVEKSIFWTSNTHGLKIINIEEMEKNYNSIVKAAQKKLDFFKTNQNRDDKLNEILDL